VISLYVGGMMLYGGYQKFAKPLPAPTKMIEQVEKEGAEKLKNDPKLVLKNYVFGLKQSGFFWQFLGICELAFGLMVLSQFLQFLGAVFVLPVAVQIFLFHVFLEPDDVPELIQTGLLLLGTLALIFKEFPKWKALVWLRP
jgi:uncharacterized membrane protein YphA (DoxX/SURF4 family)